MATDLPLGLAYALAQNPDAQRRFSQATPAQQQALIAQTHGVASRQAMHELVQQFAQGFQA